MLEIEYSIQLIQFMIHACVLAGVPLAVATLTGVVISFFQAITQIQDQTLSQTVKIAAIAIVLLAFGAVLARPLLDASSNLFETFHMLIQ